MKNSNLIILSKWILILAIIFTLLSGVSLPELAALAIFFY